MRCFSVFVLTAFLVSPICHADIVVDFADGDQFDGDGIGGTALLQDDTTSETILLTTVAGHGGIFLDSNNGSLGLGPVDSNSFDIGEFWGFNFNKNAQFQSLTFAQLTQNSDEISMQSNDWIGETFSPTDPSRVQFFSASGTFVFDRGPVGGPQQTWDLNDLTGGVVLKLTQGETVNFAYAAGLTDAAMNQMVWAVPEPTTTLVAALPLIGLAITRRRRIAA